MTTAPYPPEQVDALFHAVVRDGDTSRLEALLTAGADPNHPDPRGFPPLVLATYNGRGEAAALLLRHGAAVDGADAEGNTALGGVAFKGFVDIARQLLDAGAAVDAPNGAGRTPLMFAVMFGRAAMAELLMQHGADRDRLDAEGVSAADVARQSDRPDLVAALGLAA